MRVELQKLISTFVVVAVISVAILSLLCPAVLFGSGRAAAASPCGDFPATGHDLQSWNFAPLGACVSFHNTAINEFVGILSVFSDLSLLALIMAAIGFVFVLRRWNIGRLASFVRLRRRWKQLYIYVRLYFEKQFRQWIIFTRGSAVALV